MTDICRQCGEEYQIIGMHWSKSSSCEHPPFTDYQNELITGILMGDGCISRDEDRNPYLEIAMISPNYLKYISEQFGILGGDVHLMITGEENAKKSRDNGFRPNAKAKNYSDVYRWQSMRHPELQKFADWYKTGRKVWPDNINFTPIVLKHWYCGDGYLRTRGKHCSIEISISNEIDNLSKIDEIFKRNGLPTPSNYNIQQRKTCGGKRCCAQFNKEESLELLRYMGKPLPDFEYKWINNYEEI